MEQRMNLFVALIFLSKKSCRTWNQLDKNGEIITKQVVMQN